MKDDIAEALLIYIAQNLTTESRFLTPFPSTTIEVTGLLNKIAELRNVNEEFNGQQFNEIMDSLK